MYLQLQQLSKSYGQRQVVSNVDLVMEEGEIFYFWALPAVAKRRYYA